MQEDSNSISFVGRGVHYAKDVHITITPKVDGGIVFKRIDKNDNNEIVALYSNVSSTIPLNTTITNGNVSVSTIEHLMAAMFALKIKNAHILIDGPEVPLMDGGSSDFIFGLECLHIPKQRTQNLYLKEEISVESGDSFIIARPSDKLVVNYTVEFPYAFIGRQKFTFDETRNDFKDEISYAKTFGHIDAIKEMQKHGICLGGDMYSAIVFDSEKILSPSYVYNKDDFVRHKILDFIGDISLSSYNIKAEFQCHKTSHKLNNLLISKIFSNTKYYNIV